MLSQGALSSWFSRESNPPVHTLGRSKRPHSCCPKPGFSHPHHPCAPPPHLPVSTEDGAAGGEGAGGDKGAPQGPIPQGHLVAIGLNSWGAKALGLRVLSLGPGHRCPHHRLDIAPGLWRKQGDSDSAQTDEVQFGPHPTCQGTHLSRVQSVGVAPKGQPSTQRKLFPELLTAHALPISQRLGEAVEAPLTTASFRNASQK